MMPSKKHNRVCENKSACQAGGKHKHLRGCCRAKQGLGKNIRVQIKNHEFIEGCRKSASFFFLIGEREMSLSCIRSNA